MLTEEEINLLASAYKIEEGSGIDIEERFNNAISYIRKEDKFLKMSIEEVFKWFYLLGVNTEVKGEEISIDELCEFLEDVDFEKMVDKAINNPSSLPKNMIMDIDDANNVVSLVSECRGYECSCSPAREDCCTSEDKVKCVFTIPMKRFNEMIGV